MLFVAETQQAIDESKSVKDGYLNLIYFYFLIQIANFL